MFPDHLPFKITSTEEKRLLLLLFISNLIHSSHCNCTKYVGLHIKVMVLNEKHIATSLSDRDYSRRFFGLYPNAYSLLLRSYSADTPRCNILKSEHNTNGILLPTTANPNVQKLQVFRLLRHFSRVYVLLSCLLWPSVPQP